MVMMSGLLLMAALVIVPFTLAAARHVVVRSGRPGRLARRLAARTPSGGGPGLGATATEEFHAFLNANKRVQSEQRRTQLALRDDDHTGAPPGTRLDLDLGTAVIERHR
ncbi:DUF6191 domain-containing protein [Kitasatospora sp. NPDC002551]|uniref:DUF6191 domain-containing protein n=1 Tax=Kitasatospora sp. NPDC002551 TaxID=3154539 RepID=UPI0033235B64